MARKKTYRELKNAGYTFPLLAKFFNSGFIYVAFALLGALALTMVTVEGLGSYNRMKEEKEVISPFLEVAPNTTPSAEWAKAFISLTPPNITGWKASSSSAPSQPFTFKECNSFGLLPKSQYASYIATGEESTSLLVQLYSAGTAAEQFAEYRNSFNSCYGVKDVITGEPQTKAYLFDGGFAFTYGDAIIVFRSANADVTKNLLPWYMEKAALSLTESQCYDLVVEKNDQTRNLYVDPQSYTGLVLYDKVSTVVDTENMPTLIFPKVFKLPKMQKPEGPLPETLPIISDFVPQKPVVPETPEPPKGTYTKNISYLERDQNGPGCGWAWNGQQEPSLDNKKLQEDKTLTYKTAQEEVDNSAKAFVNLKLDLIRDGMNARTKIENWNKYVLDVQSIHEKWEWFNNERAKLYRPWKDYVAVHDDWVNFDNTKANAQKRYDSAVAECVAQDALVQTWEEEWGSVTQPPTPPPGPPYTVQPEPTTVQTSVVVTPQPTKVKVTVTPQPTGSETPTPTVTETVVTPAPTTQPTSVVVTPKPIIVTPTPTPPPTIYIPQRPASCSPPVEPSILRANKPAEPAPPVIPEGVTIPGSWVQPITTPTVKLN